jgi:CRISPR-associated endonuclease/helicase Cas3
VTHPDAWNKKQLMDFGTGWVKNQTAAVVQIVIGIDRPVLDEIHIELPSRVVPKAAELAVASLADPNPTPGSGVCYNPRRDSWGLMADPSYFRFWGKSDTQGLCHLLPYHCLDVAAVARALLEADAQLRLRLARLAGLTESAYVPLATFFVSTHDIGKFSEAFQNLRPEIAACLGRRVPPVPYPVRHDSLGYRFWRSEILRDLLATGLLPCNGPRDDWKDLFDPWIRAVTGHHGKPPIEEGPGLKELFGGDGAAAGVEFARDCCQRFLFELPHMELDLHRYDELLRSFRRHSWLLAGLAILADWVGSNRSFFRYRDEAMDLADYWNLIASPAARSAIQSLELVAPKPRPFDGIRAIFPDIRQATPLQTLAEQVPLPQGPALHIIEESTGAGKTEAAVVLAQRLVLEGRSRGVFFALPTMATSNAMFERIRKVVDRLFHAPPSVILAHSQRDLVDMVRRIADPSNPGSGDAAGSAESLARRWLSDNRKKALLATVGVGTVDQALMAALPYAHQSLRLLGLGRNVLVVDEVHAYDSYMFEILGQLIRFHAAQGGSAILLSATLPIAMRQRLLRAFAQGAEWDEPRCLKTDYPLLTQLTHRGANEVPFPTRDACVRKVAVNFVRSETEALRLLIDASKAGAAACWIRNTVDDARDAYDLLCRHLDQERIYLFHSRFALIDRLRIEADVLRRFGKASESKQRDGRVLVGTQVVEQSLDLDFDFLVSDLAPIELLIQRSGRCHRHLRGNRPAGFAEPRIAILSPEPRADADGAWFQGAFPRAVKVYPAHGQLWLGARLLEKVGGIEVPAMLRELVEHVYARGADAPRALQEIDLRAEGEDLADASVADISSLKVDDGYQSTGSWRDESGRIPTRLGPDSARVRLARLEGEGLRPWAEGPEEAAWALSDVPMGYLHIPIEAAPSDEPLRKLVEDARRRMPDAGQGVVLAPVAESGGTWNANLAGPDRRRWRIAYSPRLGLCLEK